MFMKSGERWIAFDPPLSSLQRKLGTEGSPETAEKYRCKEEYLFFSVVSVSSVP